MCAAPENQSKPRIISDGAGGAIITWHDIRNGTDNADIYAQRIDAQGKPQWTINGITLCNEANAQNSPIITTDSAGGAIIIWQDYRTNYADLYAQRVNNKGDVLWNNNGVLVCGVSGAQGNPVVINDGVGELSSHGKILEEITPIFMHSESMEAVKCYGIHTGYPSRSRSATKTFP